MSRRAALLIVLLTIVVLTAALAGGAAAQSALDGPPAAGGPEPLWVPDPEEPAEVDEPAGMDVEVAAPVALDSAVADDESRVAVAHWMASAAREAGLPGELPVMAALVESGLRNLAYGHADSVGFFQMRLGIWNKGVYQGFLARPDLQLRWFIDHATAVRDARIVAGDGAYGEDSSAWGEWIADTEQPYAPYRGRYQQRLREARALLALPAPAVAPFELGLTVGGPTAPELDPAGAVLAEQALADSAITLDERAQSDLVAGRVDPRVTAVLLAAAARSPIAIWVFQTGHSYYTVNGNVSNHSFGRAVDIGSVGGEVVSPQNDAARELALALGQLPAELRPSEIGTPWDIAEPGYFTDSGHQDHLHIGFDDPSGAGAAVTYEPLAVSAVPLARRRSSPPAEPRFEAQARKAPAPRTEPRFEVGR